MFEILVALPHQIQANPNPAGLRLGSARTAQVHLSVRTHILAAIRLFTCQRASCPSAEPLIEVRRPFLLQTPVATFVTVVVVPDQGSRILASRSPVSTGVGEDSFRRVAGRFFGTARRPARRHEARNRLIGSGPFEPASTFGCCVEEQRSTASSFKRHSSSTVTDDRRGKVTAGGEPYGGDYADPAAPLSSRPFHFRKRASKGIRCGRVRVRAAMGTFSGLARVPRGWLRIHSLQAASMRRTTGGSSRDGGVPILW
jgi:hypothetical protein